MTIYETIKAAISVKQAAEHYGLKVSHNGMACCPFHNDRHPSLKLNEDYFFCFGCGAKGDVIDLVARLFDLSSYEAAQKLAADFGLDPKPPTAAAMVKLRLLGPPVAWWACTCRGRWTCPRAPRSSWCSPRASYSPGSSRRGTGSSRGRCGSGGGEPGGPVSGPVEWASPRHRERVFPRTQPRPREPGTRLLM